MASGDMVNGGVYICSSFSVVAIKGVLVCPFTKVIHSFHTWRIIRGKEPKSTTAWTEGCGFGDKGAVHSENTPRAHSSAPGGKLECARGRTRVRCGMYSSAPTGVLERRGGASGFFGGEVRSFRGQGCAGGCRGATQKTGAASNAFAAPVFGAGEGRGYLSSHSPRRCDMRMAQKLGPHMVQNSPFS